MRSKPNETSMLETECLFGENINILDKHLNWYYCKLLTDNYLWLDPKRILNYMPKSTHRVIILRQIF